MISSENSFRGQFVRTVDTCTSVNCSEIYSRQRDAVWFLSKPEVIYSTNRERGQFKCALYFCRLATADIYLPNRDRGLESIDSV